MAEKRARTQPADTSRAVALLLGLPIDEDGRTGDRAMNETIALARTRGLTTYDAAYLELCLREALPLATVDKELRAACAAMGAEVFDPSAKR